jgi:hypothetical protein
MRYVRALTPAADRPRPVSWPLLFAACAVLAWYLAAKLALFDGLEYAGDIFAALQMSRSWAWGRSFLYENGDGLRTLFHIYYTTPLFWPLTSWLGARGLIFGSVAIYAATVARLAFHARTLEPDRARLVQAVTAAFFLGPIVFWMLDDPVQGWHVELLFLPLGVLFALDLAAHRRRALLWAALLVTTREEGAVLAWAIHALHVWSDAREVGMPRRLRRLAFITAGWLTVLLAALVCIRLQSRSAPGPSRIAQSLAHLRAAFSDPGSVAPLLVGTVSSVGLWATGALLVLAGFRARALARAAAVSIPLLVVAALGSLYYEGQSMAFSGPSWGPRFVLPWTVLAVSLLYAAARDERLPARSGRAGWAVLAVALSLAAQGAALRPARYYRFLGRVTAGRLGTRPPLLAAGFSTRELRFLNNLGKRLPHETSVLTNLFLFGPFDRQDTVWPDKPRNAWTDTYPQVVVCDIAGRQYEDGCLANLSALPRSFARTRLDGLVVAWGTTVRESVTACLAEARGSTGR